MLELLLSFVLKAAVAVVIILLVIFLIKDIYMYIKGEGNTSLFKILAKIGGVIVIIAALFMTSSFEEKGKSLADPASNLIDKGIEEINNGLGK